MANQSTRSRGEGQSSRVFMDDVDQFDETERTTIPVHRRREGQSSRVLIDDVDLFVRTERKSVPFYKLKKHEAKQLDDEVKSCTDFATVAARWLTKIPIEQLMASVGRCEESFCGEGKLFLFFLFLFNVLPPWRGRRACSCAEQDGEQPRSPSFFNKTIREFDLRRGRAHA